MNNTINNDNKIFIEKFNPEKYGFFDLKPYINVNIGFQVKKELNNKDDNNITLLGIYISKRVSDSIEDTKMPLCVSATYGKKIENGGVLLRENYKLTEPIDMVLLDEYYYDIASKEFFKKNEKITADEILKEVYNRHTKSTKLIIGLNVRMKMIFYRFFLKFTFEYISKFFSLLLKLISGETYKFTFEDNINKIFKTEQKKDKEPEPEIKRGDKISFLGYSATPECIMFYAVSHFIIFTIMYYFNQKPDFFVKIFTNAFLTLIYVMLTLILIDKIMPYVIKQLIEVFSGLSYNFLYKPIIPQ